MGWGVQTPHLGETTILWKSNSFAYRLKKPWKREPTLSVLGAVRDMASRSRAASTQKLQSNGRPVGVLASMRSGLASHSPPRSAWYKEMYKEMYTVMHGKNEKCGIWERIGASERKRQDAPGASAALAVRTSAKS